MAKNKLQDTTIGPGTYLVCRVNGDSKRLSVVKVERVTPTGIIVTTKGTRISSDLKVRVGPYHTDFYEVLTPKLAREVNRQSLINKIKSYDSYEELSDSSLKAIADLLSIQTTLKGI